MRVNAYAAPAAGEPLSPTVIERRAVGPNDVLIDIKYAGICHSDIHTVNGDWGPQPFPVVPGARSSASSPRSAPRSPATGSGTESGSAAW
jgi:Zn-dependent alcohol dehydrogenase